MLNDKVSKHTLRETEKTFKEDINDLKIQMTNEQSKLKTNIDDNDQCTSNFIN